MLSSEKIKEIATQKILVRDISDAELIEFCYEANTVPQNFY